jgi:transaldolase
MAIFLDSGNLAEIERFLRMGIIRGVTTDPTILLKDGVIGGTVGMESRAREIATLIAPLPLLVKLASTDRLMMLLGARVYTGWADNIVVAMTVQGRNGGLDNLEIAHELETRHDVRVNLTDMMSAQQCLLAALTGATYVSMVGGRVNDMGYNVCGEITRLRKALDQLGLGSKMIIESTREALDVMDWLEAGAHIVAVAPDILNALIVHPATTEAVQQSPYDAGELKAAAPERARVYVAEYVAEDHSL